MKRFLFIAAVLVAFEATASAHPVPFSFLDLQLTASGMDAFLVVHDFDLAHDLGGGEAERFLDLAFLSEHAASIRSLLNDRLQLSADGKLLSPQWDSPEVLRDRQSVRFVMHYPSVTSMPGSLGIQAAMFPYDPVHQTFVNIYEDGQLTRQLILDRVKTSAEYFTGSGQSALMVLRKFIPEGIHHILIGPDHILFLVGLLLLGGNPRRLLLVVTSFTLAHSITLSLAALDIVSPPVRVIEPAIALSIIYVGCDNLLVRKGRDVRAWIAFAFGFIHGFGFANVLREMNLPRRALGWSLFSFNFGVEIGQLLIVLIVASVLALIRSRSEKAGRYVAVGGSIAVIAAGGFWFIQRVFFPGGVS
jgi:hydrogenase/urease accessory protein HupE